MTSIGETLRRERHRRGWNLDQVAAETKISLHLLESIELDRFDRLPGGVFARNFVRQYAHMLQLDEDEILRAFHQQFEEPAEEASGPEAAPAPTRHTSPWEALSERLGPGNSLSAFVGLVLVMLACAGVYSLWQRARRSPPAPQVIASAPKPKPVAPAKPVESPKAEFRPAEVSASGTIHVPEPAASQPAAPAPAVAAEPNNGAEPENASAMRVALKASEPVWVSVKSDGTHAFSGTLESQQTREFDASKRMTVLVGNAGSLEISLNGKPVGPIGAKGEIQLLVLTPSGAHVVPRTPRTSEDSTAPTEPVSDSDRP